MRDSDVCGGRDLGQLPGLFLSQGQTKSDQEGQELQNLIQYFCLESFLEKLILPLYLYCSI